MIEIVIAETNCVRAAALLVQEITPVSSTVPTEVADGVVPVVWASGIPGEWTRTDPVGENAVMEKEEMKALESSLSHRQSMKCLPGNGRMVRTLHCSLWMCGCALQELQELTVMPRPMDWTAQPLHSCPALGSLSSGGTASPCRELWHGNCRESSQGIARDSAREVKKEGRREVRQQPSSTKFLCQQEITPVSSTVPTEVADGVVPVVWARGIPEEWTRADPEKTQ
ncbi:uncharacterized protein LOC126651447 isoform X2 [Myiozetetes cayanensis]|uniref:uncharacterized protein LOC126651447 isoform X2 n=1 Tax=Myiozetetes cayanensis TaxID=478635 RepID=UPI00215E8656|nr:uncharacterized protein LOC126651447 isoform X2 [Myiozetetes cayanensis]